MEISDTYVMSLSQGQSCSLTPANVSLFLWSRNGYMGDAQARMLALCPWNFIPVSWGLGNHWRFLSLMKSGGREGNMLTEADTNGMVIKITQGTSSACTKMDFIPYFLLNEGIGRNFWGEEWPVKVHMHTALSSDWKYILSTFSPFRSHLGMRLRNEQKNPTPPLYLISENPCIN